jgi:hypothetical protein
MVIDHEHFHICLSMDVMGGADNLLISANDCDEIMACVRHDRSGACCGRGADRGLGRCEASNDED